MAPFIDDESDSKSSQVTTSSVSSPAEPNRGDSPEPVDLSLWAVGDKVLRELRLEVEQINETWREIHGMEGSWDDRAIAHRIQTAVILAGQTTATRHEDAPSLDGTHEDRNRADHHAHAASNLDEAWAEFHGIDGTRDDRLTAHRARVAEEAASALLGASEVNNGMVSDQEQNSGAQSDGGSDLQNAPET